MTASQPHKPAAHRPSRRNVIVAAAVTVFARQGFSDTSIQEVATEAGVAPTAVYYHFSGKEELFEAALRNVLDTINEVVAEARADDEPGDPELLGHVISAVWTWLEDHPDAARLVNHHLPGATIEDPRAPGPVRGPAHHAGLRLHRARRAGCARSGTRPPGTPARRSRPGRSSR